MYSVNNRTNHGWQNVFGTSHNSHFEKACRVSRSFDQDSLDTSKLGRKMTALIASGLGEWIIVVVTFAMLFGLPLFSHISHLDIEWDNLFHSIRNSESIDFCLFQTAYSLKQYIRRWNICDLLSVWKVRILNKIRDLFLQNQHPHPLDMEVSSCGSNTQN